MRTNKFITRVLIVVIVVSVILPSFTYAATAVCKDETVYVTLNNEGKDIEKISSIWLHSDSSLNKIQDESMLEDIKNVKGEEIPIVENGRLIWETDKKDLFYQGKTNKDLPFEIEIEYYLDGKEVKVEDIVGESGEVKIIIVIENSDKRSITLKDGQEKNIYAPYIVASSVILPSDKFKNIEYSTGKLLTDGSNQILSFVSLPGLDESLNLEKDLIDLPNRLEIKADVVDFEMKPIVFTATSEIPESESLTLAKDLDELLDGIDSMLDAGEKLNNATEMLYNGQLELNNGIDEFLNGVRQTNEGSYSLKEGSLQLKEGINNAYKGSLELKQGTNKLYEGAKELGRGYTTLGEGTVEFGNNALEFSQGAKEVANGIQSIPENIRLLNSGMYELIEGTEKLKQGQDSLTDGLDKSLEALGQIKIDSLIEELEKQRASLVGMNNSSEELILALSELEEGLKNAENASMQLSEEIKNINVGQKKVKNGLEKLEDGTIELETVSSRLIEGSIGLQGGAKKLNENALKAKKGVDIFVLGANELSKGMNSLPTGLGKLNNGANGLYDGVLKLSKGNNDLAQGGEILNEGSQSLVEGAKVLNEGMEEFYTEGIKKIGDKTVNSDFNINNVLEIKDELIGISKDNNSFTGTTKDMNGRLKFIIKTEGIKMEIVEEKLDIAEDAEKKGFINWFKGLFS